MYKPCASLKVVKDLGKRNQACQTQELDIQTCSKLSYDVSMQMLRTCCKYRDLTGQTPTKVTNLLELSIPVLEKTMIHIKSAREQKKLGTEEIQAKQIRNKKVVVDQSKVFESAELEENNVHVSGTAEKCVNCTRRSTVDNKSLSLANW